MEQYKKTIEDISELFNKKKVKDLDTSIELVNTQYELLVELFDSSNDEDKLWACRYAITSLLPLLTRMLASPKIDEKKIANVYAIYKRTYAFASRRSLSHFIDYMEWDRSSSRKVYANRKAILDIPIFYLNKMTFDENLQYFRLSLPPGYGKSFLGNYYSAWIFGLDMNHSILRLSSSDEVVMGFSRAIKDLIISEAFSEVFPIYKVFNGKVFEKEKDSDWKIKGADLITSHLARTRQGTTVGVRAKFGIIFDDMTKGAEEANNDDLHKSIYEQWNTEWINRKENDRVKYIFLGTMWNPNDLLNKIKEDEEKVSPLVPSKRFPFVEECEDGHAVFITIPQLDENDNSTCEVVMSTVKARRLRDNTDEFLWSCVYQQKPIAPTGREFAWENIRTYDVLPKFNNRYVYAVLDPTRRGKDNISMPIFIKSDDNEEHYLIDWYYKKVAMTDAYDDVIDMIRQHKITHFHIENNTDTSLVSIIEMKLKEKGYTNCDVTEVFNTVKKEVRIKDARGMIKKKLFFKPKGSYTPNSMIGKAMEALTTYSFDYANKNDDAPDSLALYVNKFILEDLEKVTVTPIDRSRLNF